MSGLPAGWVVINVTGMGKDTPGSPVSDAAAFPDTNATVQINLW